MKRAAPEESDEQVIDESKVSPWAKPEMTAEGSASRIMTALLEEVAAIRRRRDAIESSATPPATALVYLFNDPMNKRRAVEKALAEVFGWGAEKSNEVMMAAHTQGRASCGEFPAAEAAELQQALSDQGLLAEVEPVLLAGKEGGEGA